jgi:phosphoribosylformylglycinamidine (FGAM) synthase-like enzyme
MWQFSEAIDGLGEACIALETPITGGNVSFYNETLGKSIYPTPTIGILGVMEDASKVQKIAFRSEGDVVVLLELEPSYYGFPVEPVERNDQREFSSSEYAKTLSGIVAGEPPAIDLRAEKRLIDLLVHLAETSAVLSAHDLSDGGLAVSLAESCFAAKGLGVDVRFDEESPAEYALFGETGARAIVSVSPDKQSTLLQTAFESGVRAREIGKVTRDNTFCIQYNGRILVSDSVESLQNVWADSLEQALKLP